MLGSPSFMAPIDSSKSMTRDVLFAAAQLSLQPGRC